MMLIQLFFSSQVWTAKFELIYSFGPLTVQYRMTKLYSTMFGNDVDAAWRRPVRLFTKFVNQKIFWFPHANSSGLFPFCVGKYDKYCLLIPWTLLYKANRDSSSSSFIILSKYRKIMQVKIRPKIATDRKEFNKLWVKLFVRSNEMKSL